MTVPSRWIIEIAAPFSSASDATNDSKWAGSTPRVAKPMILPLRLVILRAKIVVHFPVNRLTAG